MLGFDKTCCGARTAARKKCEHLRVLETANNPGWNSCRRPARERESSPKHNATIPTKLCPPDQGWCTRAYLASSRNKSSTATRLWRMTRVLARREWPQPRCGWKFFVDDDPGQLVPRNPGLWDTAPLGLKKVTSSAEQFENSRAGIGHSSREADRKSTRLNSSH